MTTYVLTSPLLARFRRVLAIAARDTTLSRTDRLSALLALLEIKRDEVERGAEPAIGTAAHRERKALMRGAS